MRFERAALTATNREREKEAIIIDTIPDLPDEEWRVIEGYGGKYLISNMGRCKSLKHANARLLTPFTNNKGYDRICLCRNGKGRHFLVSRLVAQAFCPNDDPEHKTTTDHIDGNTRNNRADNLRWMSQRDNYNAYYEGVKKQYDNTGTDEGYTDTDGQQPLPL